MGAMKKLYTAHHTGQPTAEEARAVSSLRDFIRRMTVIHEVPLDVCDHKYSIVPALDSIGRAVRVCLACDKVF